MVDSGFSSHAPAIFPAALPAIPTATTTASAASYAAVWGEFRPSAGGGQVRTPTGTAT